MKILLVEDDPSVSRSLVYALRLERFEVILVGDGAAALRSAVAIPFDLIILDLLLPERSGDQVLKHLRDANVQTPVIILTGLLDLYTKIQLFDLGADDFMVKPFEFLELLARIKAVMRKQKIEMGSKLTYHDLLLDLRRHEATRNGEKLILREKEIKILEYFLMHPEQVLTREMIMNYVWGPSIERATNVVDVHIHYLREKMDKPYGTALVKTVSSVGYKLSK